MRCELALGALLSVAACERAAGSAGAPPRLARGIIGADETYCLILGDGRLACTGPIAIPPQRGAARTLVVVPGVDHVIDAAVSNRMTAACAVDRIGAVWCWGQLGDEDAFAAPSRLQPLPPARGVAGAASSFCALDHEGAVWCWGDNREGVVEPAAREAWFASPNRIEPIQPASAITATWSQACALVDGGAVWCWGDVPPAGSHSLREVVPGGATGFVENLPLPGRVCVETSQSPLLCMEPDGSMRDWSEITYRVDRRIGE